jgi:steroid delta-isomerase-like uncharacterized protein
MEMSLASKIKDANTTLIANGELDRVTDFFSQSYIVHITGRDMKGGCTIVRDILSSLRQSFSDIQVDVEILLEGEDRVAWQRTLRATHTGSFKSFPASGRQIVWRDMVTSQFRDGLIAEEWVMTDLAEQLLLSRKRKN